MIKKFRAATTSQEAADDVEMLRSLGVEKYLADDKIEYIDIWVNEEHIIYVETGVRGFYNVYLTDGFKFCTKDWNG